MKLSETIIIDCEVYSNYFLLSAMSFDGSKLFNYEMFDGQSLPSEKIKNLMQNKTTLGFNSLNYDLPIIASALNGYTNQEIKALSDEIILSEKPSYMVMREHGLEIPTEWDHIDIIELPIGQSSLKIYGGRIHAPKMQDLPYSPDAIIGAKEHEELKRYCRNDLETTALLAAKLESQIDLRVQMSEQYGIDLRSKSDAQIAEHVLKSEIEKIKGGKIKRPTIPSGTVFKYKLPDFIRFESKQLQAVLETVLNADFIVKDTGSIELPKELSENKITIGSSTYQMGIGGIHSTEQGQTVYAGNGYEIRDMDVASFYPNIILGQKLFPRQFGEDFLKVYQSIVDRRIAAKRSGDKVTADSLKITINGSFGKLGSKYSNLYAPDLLIQTTISGQLAILMLIERLETKGINVISANTDGIVTHYHESLKSEVDVTAFEWELETGYELEDTYYRSIHSRDVNNYIAIKTDGKAKGKGVFADESLSKNPERLVCIEAVKNFLIDKRPIEDTIYKCNDIRKFVTVRTVKGGAVLNGENIGKAVRWYYAEGLSEPIRYKSNGNKVPKSEGAKELLNLPDELPTDINYEWYINEAKTLLEGLGNAGITNRKKGGTNSKGQGLFDL